MGFEGRLSELTPPEVFQLLSLTRKTGKLVLVRGARHGVVVFRAGRIVFAASDSLRAVFDESFTRVEGEEGFIRRLAASVPGSVTESGAFMLTDPSPDPAHLEEIVRAQIEAVARDLLQWREGEFRFEPLGVPGSGDVGLEPGWFLSDGGIDSDGLLLRALTALDEGERDRWERELESVARTPSNGLPALRDPADITGAFQLLIDNATGDVSWTPQAPVAAGGRALSELRRYVGEISRLGELPPGLTADVVLLVLRYAAQVVARGVLFVVRREGFRPIGQFGLEPGARSPERRLRDVELPLVEPGILHRALEEVEAFTAADPWSAADERLFAALGGGVPRETVLAPLVVDEVVVAVLYGDNQPDGEVIAALDGLAILVHEVGQSLEKARLKKRLSKLEDRDS